MAAEPWRSVASTASDHELLCRRVAARWRPATARLYQWRNVASMHFLVPKHQLHRHQGRPREQDEVEQA